MNYDPLQTVWMFVPRCHVCIMNILTCKFPAGCCGYTSKRQLKRVRRGPGGDSKMDTYSSRRGWMPQIAVQTWVVYYPYAPCISMYGIFTYIWLIFYGRCVCKYSIHGVSGLLCDVNQVFLTHDILKKHHCTGANLDYNSDLWNLFDQKSPQEDIDFQSPPKSIQDLWPCLIWRMKIICWCV